MRAGFRLAGWLGAEPRGEHRPQETQLLRASGEHADRQCDDQLPVVRADLLVLPRDPVGAGHGTARRQLHAAGGRARCALRELDRSSPQEAGDDGGHRDHHRGLPGRPGRIRGDSHRRTADRRSWAFWLFVLLVLLGAVAESARGIAFQSTCVTLLVPGARSGPDERPCRNGQRTRLRDHVRVLRAGHRAVKHAAHPADRGRAGPLASLLHLVTVRIPEPEILASGRRPAPGRLSPARSGPSEPCRGWSP